MYILSVKDHPEKTIQKLKPLGFDYRGQFNIPMHYGFNKRGAVNVNLHVYKEGHPEIELNLTFRDYLRSHPKTRDEYAALKLDLLKEKSSFEKKDSFFTGYNLGKDAFIRKVLKAAGFQLLRFVICTHYNEWEMAKKFRSRFFKAIHKKVQELANGTASARDLNRDLSRFSNPPPIGDRLGGEKFKDRDAGAASCQLLNHFVYSDPYEWTFHHQDHIHLVLYQGVDIIGYAHIELHPKYKAAIQMLIVDIQEFEEKFLSWIQTYLKEKGYQL